MNWFEVVMASAGAFGGLELIKFICDQIINRKNNARISDSEADEKEFHILQEEVLFMQQQLKEKEERFADQTGHLRDVQRQLLDIEKQKSIVEVDYLKKMSELELELATVRCDEHTCPFRQPPTALTPPAEGLTKEEFFQKKK